MHVRLENLTSSVPEGGVLGVVGTNLRAPFDHSIRSFGDVTSIGWAITWVLMILGCAVSRTAIHLIDVVFPGKDFFREYFASLLVEYTS